MNTTIVQSTSAHDSGCACNANNGTVTEPRAIRTMFSWILVRHRNYLLTALAGVGIFSWYFTTDFIGVHDAWAHIPAMKVCYDCARNGSLPIWTVQPTAAGHYLLSESAFPVVSLTFLLASCMPFVAWFKLHVFLYLLLGACGIVAYLEDKGVKHALPALAGIAIFFSGSMQSHTVFYANTWVANMAFLPWLMLCADKGKWLLVALAVALLACNGPLHCMVFVLGGSLIYVTGVHAGRRWRSILSHCASVVLGLLLAAFVVLPVLSNNYGGTVGRQSLLIQPGYRDLSHCLSSFVSRWEQAPFWVRPSDHTSLLVMWPFFYAYLGIIPFVLGVVGIVAALFMWRTNRPACVCACVCLVLFVCCCGDIWRWIAHVPLIGKLPKINIVPTRITPLMLVFGSCAACVSLSRLLGGLPRQKLICWLALATVAWASADYTLLFWQMETMQPVKNVKPLRKADVEAQAVSERSAGFAPKPQEFVSFHQPHSWVPGNGMYFFMYTTGEVQLRLRNLDTNFVARRLQIRSVETGRDMKRDGAAFVIPVAEDLYRVYLKDDALTIGTVVSVTTLVVYIALWHRRRLIIAATSFWHSLKKTPPPPPL